MTGPLLSVVMPVYNGEKYLSQAIESVLNQTYKNFELIVIDDGSKDDSVRIIKQFQKNDRRIVLLVNEKNRGISNAMNRGIKSAKGEIIALAHGDDICLPNRFAKQLDYLFKHPEVGVLGRDRKSVV